MRTIPQQESLTVEFKSDQDCLSDSELIAAVVCLANTEGGLVYLGVENDGAITGLHPKHQSTAGLSALIANRTNPPIIDPATVILASPCFDSAQHSADRGLDAARTPSNCNVFELYILRR